jgi:MoxR-like ATPase
MALLTVLAGENLLLIGPPGTAKSLIARRIAQTLTADDNSGSYFEYLLTKFSTPEEIFGPLSIAALKADCVKRNTTGYLPTVRIAFLDEIFKASSSILNALLTILNERKYHNGAEVQDVPMQALIAASNELPTGQEELSALYDRFLVRVFVDYVSLDGLPQLFEKTPELATVTPFTIDELEAIRKAANEVSIPPEIVQAIQQIWQKHREIFKEDRREQLSDRRLKKVIKLLSVAAATNGRTEVNLSDVFLLKDCLWNHPDNAMKVRDMIMGVLQGFSYPIVSTSDDSNGDITAFLQGHSISAQEDDTYSDFGVIPLKATNSKSVIKGYKGSGTQIDPILISTYQDIAGLERAEVGQKGYYFKQTADIDCSPLTTWPNIDFCGHYDGCGYQIKHNKKGNLFTAILPKSSMVNLCLSNLSLADNVNDVDISACISFGNALIGSSVSNSRIVACQAEQHLIRSLAKQCEIIRCQSGRSLIGDTARACKISDCLIVLNQTSKKEGFYNVGGVANVLSDMSVVEQCFVTGEIKSTNGRVCFSSITANCNNSTIRCCAFGVFKYDTLQTRGTSILSLARRYGRIAAEIMDKSILQNNIALDSHQGQSDAQGKDGKSVSDASFTQHYFENHLDWDFDTVWRWNSTLNRPQLQSVGVGATVKPVAPTQANTNDLLAQQISANIWL